MTESLVLTYLVVISAKFAATAHQVAKIAVNPLVPGVAQISDFVHILLLLAQVVATFEATYNTFLSNRSLLTMRLQKVANTAATDTKSSLCVPVTSLIYPHSVAALQAT